MAKRAIGGFIFCLLLQIGQAQYAPSPSFWDRAEEPNRARVLGLSLAEGVAITGSYWYLSQIWYAEQGQRDFHFFNDNDSWLQMDKIGHGMTAYYLGYLNAELYQWAGLERRSAYWIGAGSSFLFLLGIEIMDGFSEEYGFSNGDLAANFAGSALLMGQELLWGEQHLVLKFSYSPSPYPELEGFSNNLGDYWYDRPLKDYNAQTYWLSANVNGLTGWDFWPEWLNMAVGYSGDGMLINSYPNVLYDRPDLAWVEYQRQFYLAPDIDLRKIPVKSKFLKTLFKGLNFLKVPLPAVEFNTEQPPQFYWLFF